jgi:hypothetical protein
MLIGTNLLPEIDEVRGQVRKAERLRESRGKLRETSPTRDNKVYIDATPIDTVACRIVSALYYVVSKTYLNREATITGMFLPPNGPYSERAAWALAGVKPNARRSFAGRHFQFTWEICPTDPRFSKWIWSYYGTAYFAGFTLPPGPCRIYCEELDMTVIGASGRCLSLGAPALATAPRTGEVEVPSENREPPAVSDVKRGRPASDFVVFVWTSRRECALTNCCLRAVADRAR